MKRTAAWLVLLTLILAVSTLLSGCGPQPTTAPAATPRPTKAPPPTTTPATGSLSLYEHPSGLFSVSYPSAWEVEEEADQVSFSEPGGVLSILIQFLDVDIVLDASGMQGLIDGFFSPDGFGSLSGFALGEQADQGDGSILVEYSFESNGRPARGGTFFEQHGTVVYFLTFLALDDSQWDAAVPTFNEIANSFTASEAGGGPPAGWTTITSQQWSFAIDYPEGWEAFEIDRGVGIRKDEENFWRIQVLPRMPAQDPSEAESVIVANMIAAIREDDPNAQVTGPDTIVLGGVEGLYADFVYTDPATDLQNYATVIGIVYEDQAYEFLLFSLSDEAPENIPIYADMLDNFRFTR